MKRTLLALLLVIAPFAFAASPEDEAKITNAALDYAESWYTGDAPRMKRALHPDLAKRIVGRDGKLQNMGAAELIQGVATGHGKKTPIAQQKKDVKILDVFGNTASVRLDMGAWIDYLHIAKFGNEWKIVNVLWEITPKK